MAPGGKIVLNAGQIGDAMSQIVQKMAAANDAAANIGATYAELDQTMQGSASAAAQEFQAANTKIRAEGEQVVRDLQTEINRMLSDGQSIDAQMANIMG